MTLHDQFDAALPGARLAKVTPLHGGDLSEVSQAMLTDGCIVVIKRGDLVATEARMLRALADAGAETPEVLGVTDGLLVLSWLPPAPASEDAWYRCGAGLRQVHAARGVGYGWPEDYAFGSVPIPNRVHTIWPEFWAEERILPSLPYLSPEFRTRLTQLIETLSSHLPRTPFPGVLHGDLWTGNIHFTGTTGALIDPACYTGHSEVDLAMLELFGTLTEGFRRGYGPIEPGYETRRPIYQIWPALVHVRLFGSGYYSLLDRLLRQVGH